MQVFNLGCLGPLGVPYPHVPFWGGLKMAKVDIPTKYNFCLIRIVISAGICPFR